MFNTLTYKLCLVSACTNMLFFNTTKQNYPLIQITFIYQALPRYKFGVQVSQVLRTNENLKSSMPKSLLQP